MIVSMSGCAEDGSESGLFFEALFFLQFLVVIGFGDVELFVDVVVGDGDFVGYCVYHVPFGL